MQLTDEQSELEMEFSVKYFSGKEFVLNLGNSVKLSLKCISLQGVRWKYNILGFHVSSVWLNGLNVVAWLEL